MIDYSEISLWHDPLRSRPVRLSYVGEKIDVGWGSGVSHGEILPSEPVILTPDSGSVWEDVLWSTGSLFLVSKRVTNLLREVNIKGWNTYPVEVYDRKKTRIDNYCGFSITGRVGEHDVTRGEIVQKNPPVPGGRAYEVLKGFFFENDFWDGHEICFAGKSGFIVVVKTVVETIKKAKIKNVEFTPVLEDEIDIRTLKILGLWRS